MQPVCRQLGSGQSIGHGCFQNAFVFNPAILADKLSSDGLSPHELHSSYKKQLDSSVIYVPGMELLVDDSDLAPIDQISRFGKSPVSSPERPEHESNQSVTLLDVPSFSQIPNPMYSNMARR
ncbi:uncharacterized protein DEA37_0013082 [Paragonimus westermani]|uniref:Uncharacterized protein n=1 Tax=Paragonimus westermani TaxID=34504 RepID=A0A5J4N9A2_9TREM|nr:uncharacterized protein DEA37_0013082 [Paragonimus westermani]